MLQRNTCFHVATIQNLRAKGLMLLVALSTW